MSYRRVLWVETYPDRGPRRIVAGTAAVVERNNGKHVTMRAYSPSGMEVMLRRTNGQYGDTAGHWHRIADSYNETKLPNVRFWVWGREGWVKLTLEPGQSLSVSYSGDAGGEGYSVTHQQWTYETHDEDGNLSPAVVLKQTNDSTDCDGRHHWESDSFCPAVNLHVDEKLVDGTLLGPLDLAEAGGLVEFKIPRWQSTGQRQRDYFAEAMGY